MVQRTQTRTHADAQTQAQDAPPHIAWAKAAAPPTPIMKGGAREHILDILKKYAEPITLYVGILLVIGITYVGQIPDSISYRANTGFGRFVLFIFTLFIADTYSWLYALLMAIFVVLLIAVSPRTKKEGFQSDTSIKVVSDKKRWWVERVLDETPLGVEDEQVKTSAIQDSGNTSNSTTNSSR